MKNGRKKGVIGGRLSWACDYPLHPLACGNAGGGRFLYRLAYQKFPFISFYKSSIAGNYAQPLVFPPEFVKVYS